MTPSSRDQEHPDTAPMAATAPGEEIYTSLRDMAVLLVMPEGAHPLDQYLSQAGLRQLITATDHSEALDTLRQQRDDGSSQVDVVLLDAANSPCGGLSLCHSVQNHPEWQAIPVLLIVDDKDVDITTAQSRLQAGVTDALLQPVRPVDLTSRVAAALALKQERDAHHSRQQQLEIELAEHKVMAARLHYLVSHDDLSGLLNRRRLEQELETSLARLRHHRSPGALLYMDLDQFKVVNDAEGHIVGDRLLVQVANTLRTHIGSQGLLARVSSDEFAVLLENISAQEVRHIAEALRAVMEQFQFTVEDRRYHIGASIGLALINPDAEISASDVLARADGACYVAKTLGRNTVHVYSHQDTEMVTLRSAIHWVPRIREALVKDGLELVFQPIVDLRQDTVERYEALIRMTEPEGGLITPDNFIPVAERMGLMHDIDLWVASTAIEALHRLPATADALTLNINLSSHAFHDPALLPLVRRKLAETGVPADRLTFEITETAAVANFSRARDMINELRALGCHFALDDFGSGFNSFNYLREFPVDYVKIDGTFIGNLINDPVDQTLVQSMIEIAQTLGKQTIAEFVDSKAILELVRSYGADYAQGYFIGRPQADL